MKSHQCFTCKYFLLQLETIWCTHAAQSVCNQSELDSTRKLFHRLSLAKEVPHHLCTKTFLFIPSPQQSGFLLLLFWRGKAYLLWQHCPAEHLSHQSQEPVSLRKCLPSEGKRLDSPQCYVSYWLLSVFSRRQISKRLRENNLWLCCRLSARARAEALGSAPHPVEGCCDFSLGSAAQGVYPQGSRIPLYYKIPVRHHLCKAAVWGVGWLVATAITTTCSTLLCSHLCVFHQTLTAFWGFLFTSTQSRRAVVLFPMVCVSCSVRVGNSVSFRQEWMNAWGHGPRLEAAGREQWLLLTVLLLPRPCSLQRPHCHNSKAPEQNRGRNSPLFRRYNLPLLLRDLFSVELH